MTVLSAIQSAAIRIIGRRPSTIYSDTSTFALEMADLANEVAADIAKSADWQALIKVHTITGDGTTDAFDLPDDYARMLIKSDILDTTNFAWGYTRILDLNEFLWVKQRELQALPGSWILYGNQFQFVPPPANAAEAEFPYIDKRYAQATGGGAYKEAFTVDTDVFRLSERLLTLGLVWRWRQNKRLDSGEDEANFAKAFAEEAGRDKGARIFATGPARFPANTSLAYPYPLGS